MLEDRVKLLRLLLQLIKLSRSVQQFDGERLPVLIDAVQRF